jgi:amidohydrolase
MSSDLHPRVLQAVDARHDDIVGLARRIYAAPEVGFKEVHTSRLVAEQFSQLGARVQQGLALTGVKAVLEGGAGPGPTVAVLGELDSLLVWEHPDHDPHTGAIHACGHNAQVAAMLGVGMALVHSGVLASLAGRLVLFAVPAEEFIEIEERLKLRADGKLEFLAGKNELLRLGAFDDIDVAMMVHANTQPDEGEIGVGGTTNGMVAKFIRYVGRAAHAGSRPYLGVNALYAAHVAQAGINALRETFRDEDHVRVHPIITRGGDVVSAIPADVRLETFVRAGSTDALAAANRKVDRALQAGAMALGAKLKLTTVPGYLPMRQDPALTRLFRANAEAVIGRENVAELGHFGGGTDMGDLGHVMPVLHPWAAGATGNTHGADFQFTDYDVALVNPTKALALTVVDLLSNGAAQARAVLGQFQPRFTKDSYLSFVRALDQQTEYDYTDEGS